MNSTKQGRFVCQVNECNKAFYHAIRLVDHYNGDHDLSVGKSNESDSVWIWHLVFMRL